MRKMIRLVGDPDGFFESVRDEGWKPSLQFFLQISTILSIVTPVVNYLGIESTDLSSAYQAQILAYRLVKNVLLDRWGIYAYLIEPFLILTFASITLILGTGFLHVVCKLMGGQGSVLNAWKALCYGVGPCILGGFLPYVSLFAAFYSLVLQLYLGPKALYRVKESRAVLFLAFILTLTFIEMFVFGTTVGFFR